MNRVVHFDMGVVDPQRAIEFYKNVFGWDAQKFGGQDYWLMTTGPAAQPGINGGIMVHQDAQPRTVNSIAVASVDEAGAKVEAHGGKIVVPKMAIPGVGWLVYCQDTEGNLIGLHETDASAK
jgi:predicted enzyme related to lactoylglutathione lyase